MGVRVSSSRNLHLALNVFPQAKSYFGTLICSIIQVLSIGSLKLASSVLTAYRWSLSCHMYWHISQVAFRRSGLDHRWHFGVRAVFYPSDHWAVSICTTWTKYICFSLGPCEYFYQLRSFLFFCNRNSRHQTDSGTIFGRRSLVDHKYLPSSHLNFSLLSSYSISSLFGWQACCSNVRLAEISHFLDLNDGLYNLNLQVSLRTVSIVIEIWTRSRNVFAHGLPWTTSSIGSLMVSMSPHGSSRHLWLLLVYPGELNISYAVSTDYINGVPKETSLACYCFRSFHCLPGHDCKRNYRSTPSRSFPCVEPVLFRILV